MSSPKSYAAALALLPFLVACESTMSARVHEAGELAEGSPVTLAGVRVGEVKSVEVAGGDAPIVVSFAIEGSNGSAIEAGACARAAGGTLILEAGTENAVIGGQINACEPGLLDGVQGLGDALRGALEGAQETIRDGVREGLDVDVSREAGRQAGEHLRGAAEGVREGLGSDAPRELGRAVGRDAREFERGVEEGLREP